ncbi:hypothetical protein MIND_00175600 [Mycena indigotica]|uniref:Uncharacterized protein n=1 Tax=Mycena indigotica TaxID=2126181 RepID=A0A8H6WG87_9AGAR|nr:uncharacterized protein MIND_00175600 [Mycena indigotica]KAF7316562.1 hypothetical protein MIND_00175600 [Mycena indigotica]
MSVPSEPDIADLHTKMMQLTVSGGTGGHGGPAEGRGGNGGTGQGNTLSIRADSVHIASLSSPANGPTSGTIGEPADE